MTENKPTVWILEEDLASQFLFSDLLDTKYAIIFFDTVESMKLYRRSVGTAPSPALLVVNVIAAEQGLRGWLLENGSINCPILALSPANMPQIVTDKYRMHVSAILFYPYSQSQVLETMEQLLAKPSETSSALNLIRFDTYRSPRRTRFEYTPSPNP